MAGLKSFLEKSNLENLVKEPIKTFSTKEGSKKGDNVAGDIHSVQILTESGKDVHLIYKCCPEGNPILREYVIGQRVFNIEIQMYTKVRPVLEALLLSKVGEAIELPLPTYFGGLCDGANDFLCLEDLRPSGFIMPDKYAGLNVQQADFALRELAKFHAYTYFLIRHEGERLFEDEALVQYAASIWHDHDFRLMMEAMFGGALSVALDVLQGPFPDLTDRFREATADRTRLTQHVNRTTSRTNTHYFPVIIHGDFWCNNILFKYEEGDVERPIGVRFVDFQQAHRGNIFEELQYFVFTSTTPEFRKSHLSRVLDSYYDSFMSTLEGLQCPAPPNFSRGFFIDHFYETYFPALCFLPFAIPLQLGLPKEPSTEAPGSPEEQVAQMAKEGKLQWEGSPRAIQRMGTILQEFADLKLI